MCHILSFFNTKISIFDECFYLMTLHIMHVLASSECWDLWGLKARDTIWIISMGNHGVGMRWGYSQKADILVALVITG